MKQQQLAAYLGLIQDLLSCPSGEEWIHLKQHEHLVDAQFIQVMEQVASQLDKQHDLEAATFLHNWAAKLHHIFFKEVPLSSTDEDVNEAYLGFIDKLLSCPEGKEDDLIADCKTLVGPGLVHRMREFARQLRAQEDRTTALSLEKIASQLNQMWIREHNFQSQGQKIPSPLKTSAVTKTADKSAAAASQSSGDETEDIWATPLADSVPNNNSSTLNNDVEPISQTVSQASPIKKEDDIVESSSGAIAQGLNAIASALQQLNQTLSSGAPFQRNTLSQRHKTEDSDRPLAHLEALEKAYAANWQLTTEEVEQLIGVKPRCHERETMYERGNWRFTKVGQLGNQTAWQVSKANY